MRTNHRRKRPRRHNPKREGAGWCRLRIYSKKPMKRQVSRDRRAQEAQLIAHARWMTSRCGTRTRSSGTTGDHRRQVRLPIAGVLGWPSSRFIRGQTGFDSPTCDHAGIVQKSRTPAFEAGCRWFDPSSRC